MLKDVLLDAQSKPGKYAITGFVIRSGLSGAPFAWFAEETTARFFANLMFQQKGVRAEVAAVTGVIEDKRTPR